jgi:hypothetical protein
MKSCNVMPIITNSQRLRDSVFAGKTNMYRPKISLHFLVNNPAIILQINLSTKIALHLA